MWRVVLVVAVAVRSAGSVRIGVVNDEKESGEGRVRVYLSRKKKEVACTLGTAPRSECDDSQGTSQAFGVDVEAGWRMATVDETTLGYPVWSLRELGQGTTRYCVQAEMAPYRTYRRGDGVNVTLPKSCVSDGEDGSYASPSGTLYSDAVEWDGVGDLILNLTRRVQPTSIRERTGCSGYGEDTEWVKTVKIRSELLSKFWGTDMELSACVLLPFGYHERLETKYPLAIGHGHYSSVFDPGGRFDPEPPSSKNLTGYAYVDQLYAYELYRNWTAPFGAGSPFNKARMLVATLNHPVPYFDDSYAVDSVNVGPYGTAIMTELIPEIERRYRGIGEGWARGVFGGSTGGWEALAALVFNPDDFNFAAVACPDPISFTSYETINVYTDSNAFYYDAPFKKTARPGQRDSYSGQAVVPGTSIPTYGHPYGQTTATIEEMSRREVVLGGGNARACGQFGIWNAVFGPRSETGYPRPLFCEDPRACSSNQYGAIDPQVVAYWKQHFDLLDIIKRRWAPSSSSSSPRDENGLGAKLNGKLHIYVGNSDTYFLNNAVMDFQDWALNNATNPPFLGEILIGTHQGRGFEHCFNGYLNGAPAPNAVTRQLYVTKFVPMMAQRFADTAPPGADLSWHSY